MLDQHDFDYGFDLVFKFEKNSYFNNTELKKSFFMKQQQSIEKATGTEIEWKDASCDVTKTKKKKGKGKKKSTVTVKCDSFFNFFQSHEEDPSEADKDEDEEDEMDEDSPNAMLQRDLELGTSIRDDIVPLALEFYLGVIEQQDSDDDEDFEDDQDDDDDEDDKPKKKKEKKADAADPKGDKKQEECKQQ